MTSRFRKMRTYHPRRSSKTIKLNKQKLMTLEHKIETNLTELLLFLKEGSLQQIESSTQKAHSDLVKFGPDMQKLASDIGGSAPKAVTNFLDTFHTLIDIAKNQANFVDEEKINSCFHATKKLTQSLT